MIKKMPFDFELIAENVYRAKVIGGWLLKVFEGKSFQCLFIEDKEHVWTIVPSQKEIEAKEVIKTKAKAEDFK